MAQYSTADAASVILCAEFVQLIYDSINPNEGQFQYLPLYGKSRLFSHAVNAAVKLGLSGAAQAQQLEESTHGYTITRYLYSSAKGIGFWAEETTAWIGFIAESKGRLDRRDIVVAIRGTISDVEWIKDFTLTMSDFPFVKTPESGAKVHTGFLSVYTGTNPDAGDSQFGKVSMRDQILQELRNLLSVKDADGAAPLPVQITVTGHSLGAALATIAACDVGYNIAADLSNVTVSAITFGSPKVGNDDFKKNAEKHTAFIWRFRSMGDPVPSVPLWPFVHAGTELILDWTLSPYVSNSIISWLIPFSSKCHNMELHMHVLAAEECEAVCTNTDCQSRLPPVPAPAADGDTANVIDYVCKMPAWDGVDCDVLRKQLEDVKTQLKDDPEQVVQYMREIAYIGESRAKRKKQLKSLVAGNQEPSPFDKRDPSLLNKSDDILDEAYAVPPVWLLHSNKDMVWDTCSHKWLPRVLRPHDIPTPSNDDYN